MSEPPPSADAECHISYRCGKKSGTRGIGALATRQNGSVTTAQLRAAGFSDRTISAMKAAGRLLPAFRTVWFVGHVPAAREGLWHAAVLAMPTGSGLRGLTAAQNYGVWEGHTTAIDVVVPRRARTQAGIRVHTAKNAPDLRIHKGIPTVGPEQVALDLATQLRSDRAFRRAVKQLQVKKFTTHADLVAFCDARRGARGAKRLRTVLGLSHHRTRSDLEDAMLRFLEAHGISEPNVNAVILGQEADLFWPAFGLVVEVDSWFHDTPMARADDARKAAVWEAAGLRVLRLDGDAMGRPQETVQRLRVAM